MHAPHWPPQALKCPPSPAAAPWSRLQMWFVGSRREKSGCPELALGRTDLLAALTGLCLSSHVSCQENPAARSQHSRAGPGERRYQAAAATGAKAAGLPAAAGTSVVSVPAHSHGWGAPAQGPWAWAQQRAPPADVEPGWGSATGRERPRAQSWQGGKGFRCASLEFWGLGCDGPSSPLAQAGLSLLSRSTVSGQSTRVALPQHANWHLRWFWAAAGSASGLLLIALA